MTTQLSGQATIGGGGQWVFVPYAITTTATSTGSNVTVNGQLAFPPGNQIDPVLPEPMQHAFLPDPATGMCASCGKGPDAHVDGNEDLPGMATDSTTVVDDPQGNPGDPPSEIPPGGVEGHQFVPSPDNQGTCAICGGDPDDEWHFWDENTRNAPDIDESEMYTVNLQVPSGLAPTAVPAHEFRLSPAGLLTKREICLSCGQLSIHPVHDRDFSAKEKKDAAKKGAAMAGGRYPIENKQDLLNAIQSFGRGNPTDKAAIKAHIIRRANALGLASLLPGDWTKKQAARVAGNIRTHTLPVGMYNWSADPQSAEPTTDRAFATELNGHTLITGPIATFPQFASSNPNPHMLWVQGRMVGAERPNRNGHFWSTEDLEVGRFTATNGPLNWLHEGRKVIGTLVRQEMVYPSQQAALGATDQPHIAVLATLWKWLYPTEARMIELASESDTLWMSMECVSDSVRCLATDCEREIPYLDYVGNGTQACDHLREHANGIPRRFVKPTFLGAAVLTQPARPGWADAHMEVLKQAASLAESTYDRFGAGMSSDQWERMTAQLVLFAS